MDTFDINMCIEHMHNVNWNWHNNEVTEDAFKREIRKQIEGIIYQLLDFIKKDKVNAIDFNNCEKEFYYSGCGFETTGYFTVDGMFEIEMKFVMEYGFASCEKYNNIDIVNIANNR